MSTPAAYDALRTRLGEIFDLSRIGNLLFWDQQVMMPSTGAASRADQLATLGKLSHDLAISDEIGRLVEELRPFEESLPRESLEASLIRVARRDWEKARRVPSELSAELTKQASVAVGAWAKARADNDFDALRPHLERNLELRREYAECFAPTDETYDALLDDYEPGMTTAEVRAVFDRLKDGLLELLRAAEPADSSPLERELPLAGQNRFARRVLEQFGFDETSWRLDPTAHPFASAPGRGDIRLTTSREDKGNLMVVFASMHEFGHGIYEYAVAEELARTPLHTGASMALHESQSRMWENLVGRSRPFWAHFYADLQRELPELAGVDDEAFYRAVNSVRPSLIRTDADEVTYSLHIILRFELEQELLEGRLAVADLPGAWNARMKDYLDIDVPDDADGVLQDMHWALGVLGYFPTYALGNVISVQIWNRMLEDVPDVYEQIGRGEFAPLREWLTQNLYRHGRKFTPQETLELVTGSRIDPEPYLAYLRDKHLAAATA